MKQIPKEHAQKEPLGRELKKIKIEDTGETQVNRNNIPVCKQCFRVSVAVQAQSLVYPINQG